MFAITKSRSVIIGRVPFGRLMFEMLIVSPTSRPVRSTTSCSGMSPAVTFSSTSFRTTVRTPPFFRPGHSSSLMKSTGMYRLMRLRADRRRKSACVGRSLTTSFWTARQMTRLSWPSTFRLTSVDMNLPAFNAFRSTLCLMLMVCGSSPPP